jgi:hypothetical protein
MRLRTSSALFDNWIDLTMRGDYRHSRCRTLCSGILFLDFYDVFSSTDLKCSHAVIGTVLYFDSQAQFSLFFCKNFNRVKRKMFPYLFTFCLIWSNILYTAESFMPFKILNMDFIAICMKISKARHLELNLVQRTRSEF